MTFDTHGTLIDWERGIYRTCREVPAASARGLCADLGIDPSDDAVTSFAGAGGEWPAFPDSAGALRALSTRYKLAVITNCYDDLFAGSNRCLGVRFDCNHHGPAGPGGTSRGSPASTTPSRRSGAEGADPPRRPEPVPRPRPREVPGHDHRLDRPPCAGGWFAGAGRRSPDAWPLPSATPLDDPGSPPLAIGGSPLRGRPARDPRQGRRPGRSGSARRSAGATPSATLRPGRDGCRRPGPRRPGSKRRSTGRRLIEDRPDFELPTVVGCPLEPLQGFVHRPDLPDPEARDRFFASVNGPSVTVRDVPSKWTLALSGLGCRRSPASRIPAATNSSLNFQNACMASGAGFGGFSAPGWDVAKIMTRIG